MGHASSAAIYHHIDKNIDKAESIIRSLPERKAQKLLWVASGGGNARVVELLLDKLGDESMVRDQVSTEEESSSLLFFPNAVTIAARNGHKHLLQFYAKRSPSQFAMTGLKAAYWATHSLKLSCLKFILSQGDYVQCEQYSCLFSAAQKGHTDIIQYLLDKGADPNHARSKDMGNPLVVAAQEGWVDCVELLLSHGADPNQTCVDGMSALYMAARNGDILTTKMLLDNGALVNHTRTFDGASALFTAVDNGNTGCAKVLLVGGADVTQARLDGLTPLYVAAHNGDSVCVKVLLKRGADPNRCCKQWGTPLKRAARSGNAKCVHVLLANGADPNLMVPGFAPPLYAAAQKGRVDVLRLLLNGGANPNLLAPDGLSSLLVAAKEGNRSCVSLLLKRGADITAVDSNGRTALQLAQRGGHQRCVNLLNGYHLIEVTPYVKPVDAIELIAINESAGVVPKVWEAMHAALMARLPSNSPFRTQAVLALLSEQVAVELHGVHILHDAKQDVGAVARELGGVLADFYSNEAAVPISPLSTPVATPTRPRSSKWRQSLTSESASTPIASSCIVRTLMRREAERWAQAYYSAAVPDDFSAGEKSWNDQWDNEDYNGSTREELRPSSICDTAVADPPAGKHLRRLNSRMVMMV